MLGLYGGMLMEHYMLYHSRDSDFNKVKVSLDTKECLPEATRQSLLAKYAQGFWVDCLFKVHTANQKCTLPLVYWMMLMEFRGLSRIGREICHRGGVGLPLRTYDENKADLINRYVISLQKLLDTRSALVAFDNFAKYWRGTSLSVTRDTQYHLKNVTVVGLVSLQNSEKIIKEFVPLRDPRLSVLHLEKDVTLASLPQELTDLKCYQKKVSLLNILSA